LPVIVRTLRHEFRIVSPDGDRENAFAFMATEPEIVGASLRLVDLHLQARHGFHVLELPDGSQAAGTPLQIIAEVHGLILRDVLESEPDAPLVHCATIVGPFGRAALIGAKSNGKTTLALHLVGKGFAVEGDEHLMVGDLVVARPRTLRVKQGSFKLVPALAGRIANCPSITTWDGVSVHAVDPAIAGRPWRIERGRLDHLVFVEANHGGRSVMTPIDREAAFRLLVSQSLMPPRGVAAAVGRLRHLATTLPAFRLWLGDLDGAERHLKQALARVLSVC
jgi:hypothetical protein